MAGSRRLTAVLALLMAGLAAVGSFVALPARGRADGRHRRIRLPSAARGESPGALPCGYAPEAELAEMASHQDACWRPFAATSPFNTPLPAAPRLDPRNATITHHMQAYGWTVQAAGDLSQRRFTLAANEGTRPVFFATPHDPLITVHCWERYGPSSCPRAHDQILQTWRIHLPQGARPAANSDAHMTVIEAGTGREYDFYDTGYDGHELFAGVAAIENVARSKGTGVGVSAADFALSAGLLRPAELASGRIDHALVVSVPCVNATGAHVGYVWPADGGWGERCGEYWNEDPWSAPAIGALFRLDMSQRQIADSGAPRWERTIMTALARYGAYAEDTNGPTYEDEGVDIATQDGSSWTDLGQRDPWVALIRRLGGRNGVASSSVPIPINRLEVIDPCVSRHTCPGS